MEFGYTLNHSMTSKKLDNKLEFKLELINSINRSFVFIGYTDKINFNPHGASQSILLLRCLPKNF